MGDFEGKVALITGGGSGIGRATALAFAREGAKVVIGNRNEAHGREVVKLIEKAGGRASFRQTDVRIAEEVEALVNHAVKVFGGLDVAFNNAGVVAPLSPITQTTEDTYNFVMDTNVKGLWLSLKYELQYMREHDGGVIVNNASVAGVRGVRFGSSVYVASKHAVIGLTRCAALENARGGVRVNAVCPGLIETGMADGLADALDVPLNDLGEMHPIGRNGRPEEVAEAVLWLCSDKASFVTGDALMIDGGFTA